MKMTDVFTCAIAAMGLALCVRSSQAVPTNVVVRDPSTIVKQGDTYWMYGTGRGVAQFSSTDRLNWIRRGSVLKDAPAWVATAVPENRNNGVWAPDVAFFGGEYRLYYTFSTLGSNRSAIGLATNKTLNPDTWVDQGMVIQSGENTTYNALDPGVFQDATGKWWMTFGSYFSGIYIVPLDERTGKRTANSDLTRIATRPGVSGNSIEASTATYHDGWYYLFVNWGSCLAGPRSTYNVRVGRSRSVTGPYEDKTGQRMVQGGGSLFLGSVIDDGTGKPFDDQVAPGHVGILREGNREYVSTHYEWSRFQEGRTTVNLNNLAWDSDGWPRVVLDPGPYKIISELPRHNVMEVVGEPRAQAGVQTNPYEGKAGQKWTLNHLGDGVYTIGAANGLVLSTIGGAAAHGTRFELAPFQNADSQKWVARQNEDGTYSFLIKKDVHFALDVTGASNNDGVPLQLWDDNYEKPQKWMLHVR